MKKWLAVVILIPFIASAQISSLPATTETLIKQLQEMISSLQTQILELRSQLATTKKEVEQVGVGQAPLTLTISQPLVRGMRGEEIEQLQQFLKEKYPDIYTAPVTGFFGPKTEKAVKMLQEKFNIKNDGVVNENTISEINKSLLPPTTSPSVPMPLQTIDEHKTLPVSATPAIQISSQQSATTTTSTISTASTSGGSGAAVSASVSASVSAGGSSSAPSTAVTTANATYTTTNTATSTSTATSTYTIASTNTTTPVISDINVKNVTASTATVTWRTDRSAVGEVYYSLNPGITNNTVGYQPIPVYGTIHAKTLSDLTPSKTYYYVIVVKDGNGQVTVSSERSFTTLAPPPINQFTSILEKDCGLYFTDGTKEAFFTSAAGGNSACPTQADFVYSPGLYGAVPGYGVVWMWSRSLTDEPQIYFRFTDVWGQPLIGDLKITQAVRGGGWPSIVWDTGSYFAVAWQDARDDASGNNHEIYFKKIGREDGRSITDDLRVTNCSGNCTNPQLSYGDGPYNLTYTESGIGTYSAKLNSSGIVTQTIAPTPTPPANSDLTISGFDTPTNTSVGNMVNLKAQIRNAGAGAAPPYSILIAFANNSDYDPVTKFYKNLVPYTQSTVNSPSGLAAGATEWKSWLLTIPQTSQSSLYFVAKVDPENILTESDENNNSGGTQINILQPASTYEPSSSPSSSSTSSTTALINSKINLMALILQQIQGLLERIR